MTPLHAGLNLAIERFPAPAYAGNMTVHFHEEDLPEGVLAPARSPSTPRRWASIPPAIDFAWCRSPTAGATSISSASNRGAPSKRPGSRRSHRSGPDQDLPFRTVRSCADLRLSRGLAAPVYCTKTASRLVFAEPKSRRERSAQRREHCGARGASQVDASRMHYLPTLASVAGAARRTRNDSRIPDGTHRERRLHREPASRVGSCAPAGGVWRGGRGDVDTWAWISRRSSGVDHRGGSRVLGATHQCADRSARRAVGSSLMRTRLR